jgi:hypothetical protein
MSRFNIPTTHQEAKRLLNGREHKTIGNNTRLALLNDDAIGLWLHRTRVVTFNADGSIVLATGGYETVTTKDRLNRVARAHGWSVYAKARTWYVAHRSGTEFEFGDGFTIPPASSRKPAREDHCTHPEQDWCDCDWCRVVRASGVAS